MHPAIRLFAAAAVFAAFAAGTLANQVTEKFNYRLTAGDFREFNIKPGGAGQIKADADFRGTGLVQKEIAITMKLIRPDGTVAKQAVGGSPLPLVFNLTADEQAKFKGKNFKVRVENTSVAKKETITGDVAVKFNDGKVI